MRRLGALIKSLFNTQSQSDAQDIATPFLRDDDEQSVNSLSTLNENPNLEATAPNNLVEFGAFPSEKKLQNSRLHENALLFAKIANETSYLPGAAGTLLSVTTKGGQQDAMGLFWDFWTGPYWNIWGSILWALNFPEEYRKTKQSILHTREKHGFLVIHAFFYSLIYTALTAWAFYEAVANSIAIGIRSVLWHSEGLLGSRMAWIFNNAAFLADIALIVRKDLTSLIRSHHKSNPIQLLTYLFEKHLSAKDNPVISQDKKSMISYKLQALYLACKKQDLLNSKIPEYIATEMEAFKIPDMTDQTALTLASYLLNKEARKVSELKWSILINGLFSFLAATGGLVSMATNDPMSKNFQYPSAFLYVASALIRVVYLCSLCFSSESRQANPEQFILQNLDISSLPLVSLLSKKDIKRVSDRPSLLTTTHSLFNICPNEEAYEPQTTRITIVESDANHSSADPTLPAL